MGCSDRSKYKKVHVHEHLHMKYLKGGGDHSNGCEYKKVIALNISKVVEDP